MSLEVVTYANKSAGMFEELVNNDFGVKVKVLGMGKKWNGFSDKFIGLLEHMKTKKDDDIIIFVDGFDTKINKNISNIKSLFESYNCKILVSKNPLVLNDGFRFKKCDDKNVANSGMYMGYVKHLTILLKESIQLKCLDDQVNLNDLCKKYDFIKIDDKELIFKNFATLDKKESVNALFVSYPGSITLERISRHPKEYMQFYYIYILLINIALLALFTKKQNYLLGSFLLFTTFYVFYADKSCTTD
mgnify:FL=1|tara:strand:- start:243 stop:980 length:738 start_codon:yes stop_codon:yes gene_type:complete